MVTACNVTHSYCSFVLRCYDKLFSYLSAGRTPDKEHIFISIMPISSQNPMFDHLLESSHRDDSDKWSNIGFGEEITQVESIEINFTHLIWSYAVTNNKDFFADSHL